MNTDSFAKLWSQLTELAKLYITNTKLTLSEKLIRLLAMLAICALVFVLAVVAFFFISVACVHWISQGVGIDWAYLIMGGFYLLLIAVVIIFKKELVINPLARFISRLFLS